MYQCELFSVKKNNAEELKNAERELSSVLSSRGAQLKGMTEIAPNPGKLSDAVMKLLTDDSRDMFVFMNVPDADGADDFRRLFYRLIDELQANVKTGEQHKGLTPKIKVSSLGDLGNGRKGYCFSYGGKRFLALPTLTATGKDAQTLLFDALSGSEEVFAKNADKYPEGVAFYDKQGNEADPSLNRDLDISFAAAPKKQGFFKSFIPLKEDPKKLKIRKIIVLVAIAVFIGALIYVLEFFVFGPMRNNAVTSEIQEIAYSKSDSGDEDSGPAQDWDALKEINDEIVGWITIPDTVIDYPVLYHEGDDRYNQYYLKRNYKKESSEYGSIFVDYRSTDGTSSRNVIMHGHDMNDGSMFAGMLKYSPKGDLKGDLEYYQEHPVITFNTPDGDAKYKIISVYKTSTRYEHGEFFNYMQGEFNSDAEFMNFVYNSRIRSFFNIPVTCNEDDQIITLSTCCYEFYQWRCVIVARKVRPGEDENVDVELATRNSSPLFPDVYYGRYGGERPDPGTFKSAMKDGNVDWYDGKGDLEGSEDLTATVASNPTEPPTEAPKKNAPKPTEPPVVTYYPVTYRNYDGSQYAAYNVKEGDPVPVPDGTPGIPPDDEYYTYTFTGWNRDVSGVDFDHLNVGVEIYPNFEATER